MSNEYKEKPLGSAEVENVWYKHEQMVREAMNNDPYTYGGLLDTVNQYGYPTQPVFGCYPKTILEKEFSYEELQFISRCRLMNISTPDLDRLISLLNRFKDKLSKAYSQENIVNNPPGWNGWDNPYYDRYRVGVGGVQTLYGCPIPQNTYEVQKGPNEPDEQEEKQPSFSSSVWNNKPRTIEQALYGMYGVPKPGYEKRYPVETGAVPLSAEGVSSKDDVQNGLNETEDETEKKQKEFTEMLHGSTSGFPGPIEPGQLKNASLKAILDYPSTGIKINDNPVSLTEENKSVDKEDKD